MSAATSPDAEVAAFDVDIGPLDKWKLRKIIVLRELAVSNVRRWSSWKRGGKAFVWWW